MLCAIFTVLLIGIVATLLLLNYNGHVTEPINNVAISLKYRLSHSAKLFYKTNGHVLHRK